MSATTSTRDVSSSTSIRGVSRTVTRWTVEIESTPRGFRARYEEAVPPLPVADVEALARRHAPWQEMLDLMAKAAPWGFVIYSAIDADPIMRLAGDPRTASRTSWATTRLPSACSATSPRSCCMPLCGPAIWATQKAPRVSPSISQAINSEASAFPKSQRLERARPQNRRIARSPRHCGSRRPRCQVSRFARSDMRGGLQAARRCPLSCRCGS